MTNGTRNMITERKQLHLIKNYTSSTTGDDVYKTAWRSHVKKTLHRYGVFQERVWVEQGTKEALQTMRADMRRDVNILTTR